MTRLLAVLVLILALPFHTPVRAQSQFPPAVFDPSPPVAFQVFSVTLFVPQAGGRSRSTAGQPRVTITGSVIEVRVDVFTEPFTGFPPPTITVPVSPLAPGRYTLRYVVDTFFCIGGCTPTGTVEVLTETFDVVPPPAERIPTLSRAMAALMGIFVLCIGALRLQSRKGHGNA